MARRSLIVLLAMTVLLGGGAAWYRQSARVGDPQEPWTRVEAMPTARSEMPAAVLSGAVYVPGGLGAFGRTLGVFEAYHPATDSWELLEPLPLPLHHAGAASAGDLVYVAGGYTDISFRTDNRGAWTYDPGRDSWTSIADMPAPRAAHALVALDGRLYVIGGVGPRSEEVWAYDPDSGSWQTGLAPIPTPREHLAAVALDGRIYAIGGRVRGRNLAALEIYDPGSDSWTSGADMPTARSGLSAATVAGLIHVAGGEDLSGSGTFDTHEVYDPGSGEWHVGASLTTPRHGLATAAVADVWYLIGGATRAGAETIVSLTDTVEALDLEGDR